MGKEAGAVPVDPSEEGESSSNKMKAFSGGGFRLGSDETPSAKVGDAGASALAAAADPPPPAAPAASARGKINIVAGNDEDSDEDDDEDQQAFFAGGSSHSGNVILGPKKKKMNNVGDFFKAFKEAGAVPVDPSEEGVCQAKS